jgi:hypothetical protein
VDEQVEAAEVPSVEARLLALAYSIESAVEDEHYESVAAVAGAFALSRARLSRVLRRRWAPVVNQETAIG